MFNFNLFKKPETSVVGVDIGTSSIKVVELIKRGSRAFLATYGALALGPYAGTEIGRATKLPPEKIAEALLDLFRESKVKSRQGGVAIPVSSTLMSLIQLPKVGRKELETMVPLEARKYIPVPISEVSLDWSIVPRNELSPENNIEPEVSEASNINPASRGAVQDILLVAIHNEALARYQDIIAKAGLDTSFFEVELFSTLRSIASDELSPVMVVDIGAAATKLYIVERGVMRISHTIDKGSQDITLSISKALGIPVDKAEIAKRNQGLLNKPGGLKIAEIIVLVLDYIFTEANSVIGNYQRKYSKSLSKIYLVGGGSAMPGMIDFAKARFQTDVFLGNPFSEVDTPAFLTDILKNNGPEFAVAVGIALRKLREV